MDIRGRLDYLTGKALVHFLLFFKKLFPPDPKLLGSKMAKQDPRSKETMLADMKQTLEFLKELGVEVTEEPRVEKMKPLFKDDPDTFYVAVDLPFDKTSDYSFDLSVYDDGQRNIGANLLDENKKPLDVYFWYCALEIWDGYYSLEELVADFHKTLRLVVENETRVIMSEYCGDWKFGCIAKVDGKWQKVRGGSIAVRGHGFKFPKFKGLRKTFSARPLVTERK